MVFRAILAFGKLCFVHASTNATDDHKYSPLPSADFDSSGVLISFSTFRKKSLLTLKQGFFLAVFSATQENGLSETLSFEEILGLSFGKMLEFLRNFVKNLHFRGKF